jgi:hypothetical protein
MQAAANVNAILMALPTVTESNYAQVKLQVQAARNAYNSLGMVAQPYVTLEAYQKLTAAESAIAAYEASAQAQSAAASVSEMIRALVDVTETNYASVKQSVVAARSEYNTLSSAARAYVSADVLSKLETAEELILYYENNSSSGGNTGGDTGSDCDDGSVILPTDSCGEADERLLGNLLTESFDDIYRKWADAAGMDCNADYMQMRTEDVCRTPLK